MVQKHIKDLVTLAAKHVMDNGGVVRSLDSWGTLSLPQKMYRHDQWFKIGESVQFFIAHSHMRGLTSRRSATGP